MRQKTLFVSLVLLAVAIEPCFSAGFLVGLSPVERRIFRSKFEIPSRNNAFAHVDSLRSRTNRMTRIRGGGRRSEKENDAEELEDLGGAVAGLFGNLRIPASLLAGASLGSAFALPLEATDGALFGFAKRLYTFLMLTTLGSMLLVLILSTICMNDIAICPPRLSKNAREYIDANYGLEWMLVKSHFYYGALAFVSGALFRAWVCIACPVVGRGVIGILSSLSLVSVSTLLEKSRNQGGGVAVKDNVAKFLKSLVAKGKASTLFGSGIVLWVTTVAYLIINIPHMYHYMASM